MHSTHKKTWITRAPAGSKHCALPYGGGIHLGIAGVPAPLKNPGRLTTCFHLWSLSFGCSSRTLHWHIGSWKLRTFLTLPLLLCMFFARQIFLILPLILNKEIQCSCSDLVEEFSEVFVGDYDYTVLLNFVHGDKYHSQGEGATKSSCATQLVSFSKRLYPLVQIPIVKDCQCTQSTSLSRSLLFAPHRDRNGDTVYSSLEALKLQTTSQTHCDALYSLSAPLAHGERPHLRPRYEKAETKGQRPGSLCKLVARSSTMAMGPGWAAEGKICWTQAPIAVPKRRRMLAKDNSRRCH